MATADVATVDVAGDGVALFYGSIVLLVLSWTIFCMRVGVRVWRKAFGLDDYIMFVGIVSSKSIVIDEPTDRWIFNRFFSQSLLHCA